KNISGTGMDTKVVNRSVIGAYNPWPNTAKIRRIFVRDISSESYGNGLGIGMADMTTNRLVKAVNWEATAVNVLTSTSLGGAHIPLHYEKDQECLERLSATVGKLESAEVTYGWIRNSLEVARLALSENLRGQIESNAQLEIEGELDFDFDAAGNLASPFAEQPVSV
ncbi:MAG TPA: hypothetical protein VMU19_01345, partial [Bryobacteraceae bacterium]|nr:hypothetical protein [Bryobacteraceae bacterium]